jgi:hypothetical protein
MQILIASADAMEVAASAVTVLGVVQVLCIVIGTFFIIYKIVRMINRMDWMS